MVKKQYSVRLPRECEEWLEKKIKIRVYNNATHGIEVCIREQMKKEGIIHDE